LLTKLLEQILGRLTSVVSKFFLLLLISSAGAEVSFQYDLAGNRVTQSNVAAAVPPTFQEFGPQYIGADTNGLLTVSVPVTGVGPFTYQWFFNGVAINGGTNGSFLLTNATANNLGKYQLVAANNAGSVTSAVVNVSFLDPEGSGLPVAWELAYFGVTGVNPDADPDRDGVSNYQEFLDGTDPTNPKSVKPRLYIPDYVGFGTVSVVPLKSEYQLGENVQVTALPDPGRFFINWTGSNAAPLPGRFTNPNASLTVVMNSTFWLTPLFLGPAVAWGYNEDGEINVPAALTNVVAIAAGSFFSLALQGNGTVTAWGLGSSGDTNVPAGLSNVVAIAAGGTTGLALQSNGTVTTWGYQSESTVPAGLSNVVAIAGGGYFSLALKNDGAVVGWGDNGSGQSTAPAGLSNVVAIAAGFDHSLALQGNGMVTAWGDNTFGETNVPAGLTNVVAIAAGNYFSLALVGSGMVKAWGENIYGQTNVPAGLSNVVAIAAGDVFGMALQINGTVTAWGNNYYGTNTVPGELGHVVGIAGGEYHSLALLNDGSPFIIRQPVSIVVQSGETALLSAGIVGAPPLSYQWQLNGTNLAGATNSSYALASVQANQTGTYTLVITNMTGQVTSAKAVVTIIQPLLLLSSSQATILPGGGLNFTFELSGPSGSNYVLETSTNLFDWSSIKTSSIPLSGSTTLTNSAPGNANLFFRAYLP
jgi:hypothetical protein